MAIPFYVICKSFLPRPQEQQLVPFAKNSMEFESPFSSKYHSIASNSSSGGTDRESDEHRAVFECKFCRKNGQSESVYQSHVFRTVTGELSCYKLREYICPICQATGAFAHTIKYCPALKPLTPFLMPADPFKSGCALCRKNGLNAEFVRGHILKTVEGKVVCPVLRACVCPICKATGDDAHTKKYCPLLSPRGRGLFGRANGAIDY